MWLLFTLTPVAYADLEGVVALEDRPESACLQASRFMAERSEMNRSLLLAWASRA